MEKKDCCGTTLECCEGGNTYIVNIHNGGSCCCASGTEKPDPGPTDPGGTEKPDPGPTDPGGTEKPDPGPTDPGGEEKPDPVPSAPGEAPDPEEVYKATRPKDWLPMPEPKDDEMYLLFHIPDGYSSLIAFTVTCELTFTVEAGTVVNGAFVPNGTLAKELATGKTYENELFAKDFGGLTSTRMRQCMLKVSGKGLETWLPALHSKRKGTPCFWCWNIMEINAKLPNAKKVKCHLEKNIISLKMLQYFTLIGPNKISDMSYMFNDCHSLVAVRQLDTSKVTTMGYMFRCCYPLVAIPALNMRVVANTLEMFSDCCCLTTLPMFDIQKLSVISTFGKCYSLVSAKLNPEAKDFTATEVGISGASMTRASIVDFFRSLPTVTGLRTVGVRGNPGAADLVDDDIAIARGKGWTVTAN